MEKTPLVSIIIATWNTAAVTLKCIQSIQKYLPHNFYQIIVIDNGSTDNTEEIFSKIKSITYLKNSTNLGFSQANNIGAQHATAPYLFFLNSDMELLDSSLTDMVKYLEDHQEVGLVGPQFLNPDLTIQGSAFPPQTPYNAFKEYWLGENSYSKYYPSSLKPTNVWGISGGAMLLSRELFFRLGKWNEKYFMFYEDLELCRSVRKFGKKIICYPECKVIHYHGASGKTVSDPANQWRRLIPSSKKYFGLFTHYLIFLIIWSSQKLFHRS